MSAVLETRTYRGVTLEEILPRIRAELGPEAVITRRRDGIIGGIGGFFGKRCVEVEVCGVAQDAVPPAPSVPVGTARRAYELPDESALLAEMAQNPLLREMMDQAAPFADYLETAVETVERELGAGEPAPAAPPAPEPPAVEPAATPAPHLLAAQVAAPPAEPLAPALAAAVAPEAEGAPAPAVASAAAVAQAELVLGAQAALLAAGLPAAQAEAVVREAAEHVRPFAPAEPFPAQVRHVLARRIPVSWGWGAGGRTVCLVGGSGSGRSLAAARLANAYALAGRRPVALLSLEPPSAADRLKALAGPSVEVRQAETEAEARLASLRLKGDRLLVVDTPPVSALDPGSVLRLAGLIGAVEPDETHLVLSATTDPAVSRALADALAGRVALHRILVTRLDETPRVGGTVGLALERELPLSYVAASREADRGLAPADPFELARLVLP